MNIECEKQTKRKAFDKANNFGCDFFETDTFYVEK